MSKLKCVMDRSVFQNPLRPSALFIIARVKEGKSECATMYISYGSAHSDVADDFRISYDMVCGGGDVKLLDKTLRIQGLSHKFGSVPKVVLEKFQKALATAIKANDINVKNISVDVSFSANDPKWQNFLRDFC